MDASNCSMKRIPCAGFTPSLKTSQGYTVKMVTHPMTKHYRIFMAFSFADLSHRVYHEASMFICHYDSHTKAWLGPEAVKSHMHDDYVDQALVGVAFHTGQYLALIQMNSRFTAMVNSQVQNPSYRVIFYVDWIQAWMHLPGGTFALQPESSSLPDHSRQATWPSWFSHHHLFMAEGILMFKDAPPLLFDHSGRLFMAIVFMNGCHILEYEAQEQRWALFDSMTKPFVMPEEQSAVETALADNGFQVFMVNDIVEDLRRRVESHLYQRVVGDYLYVGRWLEESENGTISSLKRNTILSIRYGMHHMKKWHPSQQISRCWDKPLFFKFDLPRVTETSKQRFSRNVKANQANLGSFASGLQFYDLFHKSR